MMDSMETHQGGHPWRCEPGGELWCLVVVAPVVDQVAHEVRLRVGCVSPQLYILIRVVMGKPHGIVHIVLKGCAALILVRGGDGASAVSLDEG
jgi:hypothetical protein